ncbi:MAG: alpha/beta fold hydrolase [Myxococcaceae bacterium]
MSEHLARAALLLAGCRSRTVLTSAGRVHVLDLQGSGPSPAVVLLHGFSAAAVHYLPLMRRLRPGVARVVVPDLPAHGFSEVPRAGVSAQALQAGLLEALDGVLDAPAVFYGNSMGGLAAVRYALARPARVAGLLLCSPGGAAMSPTELAAFAAGFRLGSHAQGLDFVDRVFGRRIRLRHFLAWAVRRRFAAPPMRALLDGLSQADLLRPKDLRNLTPPVRLVWGKADGILPLAHREFFRRHLPAHALIDEPAGMGHSPYLDRPAAVARQILDFARELGAPLSTSPACEPTGPGTRRTSAG